MCKRLMYITWRSGMDGDDVDNANANHKCKLEMQIIIMFYSVVRSCIDASYPMFRNCLFRVFP